MLNKYQRIGLWVASILTALVGVVNLIFAATPAPIRTELLQQFIPFDIRAGGHFFAAITGFILLTLAANLLRRKRVAWLLTVVLLLEIYKSLGYQTVQIGEEAIVDLHNFTLHGKANQSLRNALNRLTKSGHQVKFYQPPIADELLKELKIVSDEWLNMMQGAEKKFSVGWFDDDYLRKCEIVAVHTPEGTISAFANVVSEYQKNEITIDLMRRRTEIEKETMEFLFISMFQHFQQLKYDGFNLGLSALSGVGETQNCPNLEKTLKYFYEHLNRFYNFKGLHIFKNNFNPRWEPRYLVYPNLAALPNVAVALVRADSEDRLLDYFKPGA